MGVLLWVHVLRLGLVVSNVLYQIGMSTAESLLCSLCSPSQRFSKFGYVRASYFGSLPCLLDSAFFRRRPVSLIRRRREKEESDEEGCGGYAKESLRKSVRSVFKIKEFRYDGQESNSRRRLYVHGLDRSL